MPFAPSSIREEGNLAALTVTGKLPLGSEAAWLWPPPQPDRARVTPTPASIAQVRIFQAFNAGGTYHQGRSRKPGRGGGGAPMHRGLVPCWDPPPLWVGLCRPETFGQAADPWED